MFTNFEELAKEMEFDSADDFLAAAGSGGITPHQIAAKLSGEPEEIAEVAAKPPPHLPSTRARESRFWESATFSRTWLNVAIQCPVMISSDTLRGRTG